MIELNPDSFTGPLGRSPWRHLLARLFNTERPTLALGEPVDQSPAFECQVVLKSGYKAAGALSYTPEGMLRLMMPGDLKTSQYGPSTAILAEHFFSADEIETLIMIRKIEITSHLGNGKPTILIPGQ